MSAQLGQAVTPAVPQYLVHLVDRAGTLLNATWPRTTSVDFTWWTDGKDDQYMARLDWPLDRPAPRVVVFDRQSGDFRCQSLEGNLYEIDPTREPIDPPPDEIDRDAFAWDEDQRRLQQQAR